MTDTTLLPFEHVQTHEQPDISVIWLHGLGANGYDFIPIAQALELNQLKCRFIFPHAPERPVTINGGMIMPAWYDIFSMSLDRRVDLPQVQQSALLIQQLIKQQVSQGITANRIVIAGFSQGGAVAYEAALTYPETLGGLLAMSTYLARGEAIQVTPANRQLPVLIQHGTLDPVVPLVLGDKAAQTLNLLEMNVRYLTYPIEHAVCPDQIHDISEWLKGLFQ